ncbi:MAG: sugar transporter [Pseudomonadota bacterium]
MQQDTRKIGPARVEPEYIPQTKIVGAREEPEAGAPVPEEARIKASPLDTPDLPKGRRARKRMKVVHEPVLDEDDDDLPPVKPMAKVRPPVGPARFRRRHRIVVASFFGGVMLPVLAFAFYLYNVAVDQYASSFAFTVRNEEAAIASPEIFGLQVGGGGPSVDAQIVNEFILSQQLVDQVDQELDLVAMYSKPDGDPLFTFHEDGTIEDLLSYWQSMVTVALDADKGLLEVRVLAFDPEDAQSIGQEILRQSSDMINRLSAVAQEDATRYARAELERAVERLKEARQALSAFRSSERIVDVDALVASQMGVLSQLQEQLVSNLIEFDLLLDTTREGDPRLAQARRKISVIEERIEEERAKLSSSGTAETDSAQRATVEVVGRFEELQVDLEFAQQSYLNALAAFDASVEKARRQSRYLAAYVEPTLAQRSEYPLRSTILGVFTLFLFLIWAVLALVFYSIRDRR